MAALLTRLARRCRREDHFDGCGHRISADNDQQRVGPLPVPRCASGQLPTGGIGERFCALLASNVTLVVKMPSTINIQLQVAGVTTT